MCLKGHNHKWGTGTAPHCTSHQTLQTSTIRTLELKSYWQFITQSEKYTTQLPPRKCNSKAKKAASRGVAKSLIPHSLHEHDCQEYSCTQHGERRALEWGGGGKRNQPETEIETLPLHTDTLKARNMSFCRGTASRPKHWRYMPHKPHLQPSRCLKWRQFQRHQRSLNTHNDAANNLQLCFCDSSLQR